MLVDLAEDLGHDAMAASFRVALQEEAQHLDLVREWLESALRGQAGVDPPREIARRRDSSTALDDDAVLMVVPLE